MLDESLKLKDESRFNALKRSLLDIERQPCCYSYSEEALDLSPSPKTESSSRKSVHSMTRSFYAPSSTTEQSHDFSPVEEEYLERALRQNVKQHEIQIKIMIVGSSRVGKTSLMHAFMGQAFQNTPPKSIGLDSRILYRETNGKHMKYKFIDSDADKGKECIRKVYYEMSKAVVLVYDIASQESFDDARFWHQSILKQTTTNKPLIFLVGNKADVDNKQRVVPTKLAKQYAKLNHIHFSEVSTRDMRSIQDLLDKITDNVINANETKSNVNDARIIDTEKACLGCIIT